MSRKRMTFIFIVNILAILALSFSTVSADSGDRFKARLRGANEVPPVSTEASGKAIIKINDDDDDEEASLKFRLIVHDGEGVTQAHIHCGAAGVNGPVVVFLFGFNPAGVDVDGLLAKGTITDANVIARQDSPQCPGGVANLDDLIAKIRSGDAYVNVHTVTNPGGEIRGQLY